MGGGEPWGGPPDDPASIRAIHAALDAGVTLLDTAPAYGWGHCEEIVGRAVAGRRDQVVLATKCGLWWDDARGSYFCDFDGKPLYRSLRPDTIRIEVENSLRRLATDRIDLYQAHWPAIEPDKTAVADTMAALLELRDQGKIRAIGACNLAPGELADYHAGGQLASHQFRYSMLTRGPEAEVLPWCRSHGVATLTYMSLEQGLLTGKIGLDRVFAASEWRGNEAWNPWFKLENRPRVLALLDGWRELAAAHDATPAQLVLAWTLARPGVTHVLAGASRPQQIQETAAAATLRLSPEALARIDHDLTQLGEPA
jgi:methylglyoxal reductase